MGRAVVKIGDRFGRLLVVADAGRTKARNIIYNCLCICGNKKTIPSGRLRNGNTRSCGCLLRDRMTVHGLRWTAEYEVWKTMKQRCYNPRNKRFSYYGARGIVVCERWRKSFSDFLADVGLRPSQKHSLDRIKNEGNYEPGNVRWATAKQQANNRRPRRKTREVLWQGKRQS